MRPGLILSPFAGGWGPPELRPQVTTAASDLSATEKLERARRAGSRGYTAIGRPANYSACSVHYTLASQDHLAERIPMIAAVLFDLYETLITESAIRPARASSLAATLGLEENAYRAEWKKRRPRIVRGEMSFADALAEISQYLIGRVDLAVINRIRQKRIREKAASYSKIDRDVGALVTLLAGRGISLAVVSNGFQEDVIGWSHCLLAPKFQCIVFSYAEHVAKPDPEIYLRAVHRLSTKPATAVYIGDGSDDELAGAERAGLRAGRAAWYVRDAPQKGMWPELTNAEDVLRFIEVG